MKALCFLFLLLVGGAPAFAVQGTRGGGDRAAQDFLNEARRLSTLLREHESLRQAVPELNPDAFDRVLETVQVESKDELFLERRAVDAINYPDENRIELNRKRWDIDKDSSISRMSLVAHEFLGLLRIADPQYAVSHRVGQWLNANGLGSFECRIERGLQRDVPEERVRLERQPYINATNFELFVDDKPVMIVAHFRSDEHFSTITYWPGTRDGMTGATVEFRAGAMALATYTTAERRFVRIACNK